MLVQGIEYFITASAGVAVYPVDGENPETLIKNADIAMYRAKTCGKNQCIYCSPELKDETITKMKLFIKRENLSASLWTAPPPAKPSLY